MKINPEIISVIDLIKSKSIFNIKCGDSISSVLKKMKGIPFKEINQKNFDLFSFENVEFAFDYKTLSSIHIERNKPDSINLIDLNQLNFDECLNLLHDHKINISKIIDNKLIYIENNNISLTFLNNYLVELVIS